MSSKSASDRIIDGKYRIEKQLGKGGMGTVFLATHIGTGRPVAVKVIAAQFMEKAEFVERFRREAQAAGRLRHPNVVDVTDFGFSVGPEGEKTAYLVMEYLDGCTLGEVLDEEEKIPVEFTIEIMEQVCSAVDEAHRQGIIHRDLKPDNIWLEPNQRGGYTVKVLDFGIAKLEEAQVAAISELPVDLLVRDVSKTRLSADQSTIAESDNPGTRVEGNPSTVVGEGETLALGGEGETLSGHEPSEAGTMLQEQAEPESDGRDPSEVGTVAIPSDSTGSFEKSDERGTRLNSGVVETDERDRKGTADLTRAGAVLGTPLYMSPEQCRGEKLTPASDIYSLSVIVYQMLSGTLPFTGDYVEVMNGHKNEEPPPLLARKVPKKLTGIVMSSLAKKAEERPDSAEALASKLRSNSEGLGVLLRRGVILYSEHLPKFVLLALIVFLPLVILTFLRVGVNFLYGIEYFESELVFQFTSGGLALAAFFVQIVTAAILVGTTTWLVGRILAFPLRPVSLRAAFRQTKHRWKSLTGTVTLSTILSILAWVVGLLVGLLGGIILIGIMYKAAGGTPATVTTVVLALIGAALTGTVIGSLFMLIAPSIMMENVSGRAAFKRSVELTRRSFRTVFATSILVYVVPIILALAIGFSVGSIIKNFEMRKEIAKMKKEGVVAEKVTEKEENAKEKNGNVNFAVNKKGISVNTSDSDGKDEEKDMAGQFSKSLQEGIFELIWTPLAILISSFTSVITALIYFKTRQAGGESLQNLLGKLEDEEQHQSKWEARVRERLIQSGKITGSVSQG